MFEGTGKYGKPAYSPSPMAERCAEKASKIYSHENARQAVVWGLQAQGVKPSQIQQNAEAVVEAATELGEMDVELNSTGHGRRSDLHAEGKFKQQARLRRVLCKGVTGQVERSVSKLGETHGLKGMARVQSAPSVRKGLPGCSWSRTSHPALARPKETDDILPMEQVRSLFKERMRSVMLQDMASVRRLFAQYDVDNNGWIPVSKLHNLCHDLGVDIPKDQLTRLVRKLNDEGSSKLQFGDFVHNLLALPHDFFSMKFDSNSFIKVPKPVKARNPLPKETPVETTHKVVVKSLRDKMFNLAQLKHAVFKAMPGKHMVDRIGLWETFNRLGVAMKEAEFEQIFDYYNLRRNGKVYQIEFICDLLDLSYPQGAAPPPNLLLNRPKLSQKAQVLMKKLKNTVERVGIAGKTPAEKVRNVWKNYDTDGSGEISYDEIHKMTAEFDIGVEGRNAAAEVLSHVDQKGEGALTYQDFVKTMVQLDPEVFQTPGAPEQSALDERPSTPELRSELAEAIKGKVIGTQAAAKRAFKVFDQQGDNECSFKEFRDAFKKLGLPVRSSQVKTLFNEVGPDQSGLLGMHKFHSHIVGGGNDAKKPASKPSRPASSHSKSSGRSNPMKMTALDLEKLIQSNVAKTGNRPQSAYKPTGHVVHTRPKSFNTKPTVFKVQDPMKKNAKCRPRTALGRQSYGSLFLDRVE